MSDQHGLLPGDELEGRFRIEGVLGEGSFSTVYRATQMGLGRTVAIKWMKTRVRGSDGTPSQALDDLIDRFRREAQIIARLDHPATITLHDYGRTSDENFYMVLEHVDGAPVNTLRWDRIAPNRVVTLLEQALGSLGEAHDHGIVHRDIKPNNLMLYQHRERRDRLKILDFGIAKVLRALDDETLRQITGESALIGTPRYIAPENASNRDPGPAADIYSLGLVAYELLLGERAVPDGETLDILDQHLASDFQVRIEERPAVPKGLRQVINRMVEKDLVDRYGSADAVLADLRDLPDYGDAYGATEQVRQPPALRDGSSTRPEGAPTTTESLPEVSAYGDTPDIDEVDLDDVSSDDTANVSFDDEDDENDDSPISGTSYESVNAETFDETAPERPTPAADREGDGTGDDMHRADAEVTSPTRRASVPAGQTCDVPDAISKDDGDDSDDADRTDSSDTSEESGRRSAVIALVVLLTAVLVVIGVAFI